MLLRLKQLHINHMSCPVESDLKRHMQKLDEQAAEEKHLEENPSYYYLVKAYKDDFPKHLANQVNLACTLSTSSPNEARLKWEEYAYSEEEKNEHIAAAKEAGLIYTCKKEIVELNY